MYLYITQSMFLLTDVFGNSNDTLAIYSCIYELNFSIISIITDGIATILEGLKCIGPIYLTWRLINSFR